MAYKKYYDEYPMIVEIKMSRVLKHFTQEKYPVGIITAFRGDINPDNPVAARKKNIANNKELASFLRGKGYGFVYVDGGWIEDQGTSTEKEVSEDSIFCMAPEGTSFDEFAKVLQTQAKKYNQDAFLAYDHENKKVKIIGKDGRVQDTFNTPFKISKAAAYFTRLKKNGNSGKFFFERYRYPVNWITRMALKDKDQSDVIL